MMFLSDGTDEFVQQLWRGKCAGKCLEIRHKGFGLVAFFCKGHSCMDLLADILDIAYLYSPCPVFRTEGAPSRTIAASVRATKSSIERHPVEDVSVMLLEIITIFKYGGLAGHQVVEKNK
jgi:hypothetical protein